MTHTDYSKQELVRFSTDSGASGAFVAAVATDIDGRHIAREVAYKHHESGGGVTDSPPAGGFATALWRGDVAKAWKRADSQSKKLLRATAGLESDGGLETVQMRCSNCGDTVRATETGTHGCEK